MANIKGDLNYTDDAPVGTENELKTSRNQSNNSLKAFDIEAKEEFGTDLIDEIVDYDASTSSSLLNQENYGNIDSAEVYERQDSNFYEYDTYPEISDSGHKSNQIKEKMLQLSKLLKYMNIQKAQIKIW